MRDSDGNRVCLRSLAAADDFKLIAALELVLAVAGYLQLPNKLNCLIIVLIYPSCI